MEDPYKEAMEKVGIKDPYDTSEIHGWICGPRLYEYEGWFFEVHSYGGPWPLKKDGELRARAGRVFWKMWKKFDTLSEEEQEEFRVGGGCQQF